MRRRKGKNSFWYMLGIVGTAIAVAASSSVAAATVATLRSAGAPTTGHGVQPTFSSGRITSCPRGTTTFINTFGTRPGDQSKNYSSGGTTFQTTVRPNGKYLSFITNSPSFTVYIAGASADDHDFRWWDFGAGKGWWGYDDHNEGSGYDTYNYSGTTAHPAQSSDSDLHAPLNNKEGGAYSDHGHYSPARKIGTPANISYYIVCGQPITSTASPSLGTTPSAGGQAGTVVLNDSGTLSGGASPTGSITFNLYAPTQTCGSGAPAYTQTVPVSGNGTYSTTNVVAANGAGTWSWTAMYSGDSGNGGASSTCGLEAVTVTKASPALGTTPSAGGEAGTVVLNDSGTLSGGVSPGGSIVFNLYAPTQTCGSGTPAYTQTVPVSGNGSYSTTNAVAATSAGTWSWTAAYAGDSNNNGASSACGQETVTVTPTTVVPPGSCAGTGSISPLVSGTNVLTYVPKGSWGSGQTGIDVVNTEGNSITNTQIPTGTDVINSCASNPVTGQTVCTANNNDVWVLKGTGLDPSVSPNPLTDGGTGEITFSGGSATTSGVAMDATDNQVLLAISIGGVGGYQFLDLATDTFEPPFVSQNASGQISEDPLLDPVHHIIGSASEDNHFEIVDVSNSTSPKFYEQDLSSVATGNLDSTSEDCSTGILLAPAEFSSPSGVEVADIQNAGTTPEAVFTPGTPGSWTAPEQFQALAGSDLAAGANGSAVAQGTHTGVISGEFGGDGITALALPTTSGAGATPSISNWVSCATGADPTGNPFSMGLDPHTLAAYQSPNGGDAIALLVNGTATEMVRVDLTQMLNATTVPVTGNVCDSATLSSTVESFTALP